MDKLIAIDNMGADSFGFRRATVEKQAFGYTT